MDGFDYKILFPIFIVDSNITFYKFLFFIFIHILISGPLCFYLFYHLPIKIYEFENRKEVRSFNYRFNVFYETSKKMFKSFYYNKLISFKKILYNK
jgi:hypothetical protein